MFDEPDGVTVNYLPATTGWGEACAGGPTAVGSAPLILRSGSGFGAGADGFGFLMSWATDSAVVVEASPALALPNWAPVSTNTLNGGTSQFTDPQWTHHPARLYRVVSP